MAVDIDHTNTAELLLKMVRCNFQDKYGWMVLMRVAETGRIGKVQLLLEKGANINAQDVGLRLLCGSFRWLY
jgi:ankyrin repeat protein